jgi:hypothetical protein
MTAVPLIIIGIPLNLNGRNLKEHKTSNGQITGAPVVQL